MLPAFIIWTCGGVMVICGVFVERRTIVAAVALAGTIVMGLTSNAVTVLNIVGAGLGGVAPKTFVPATCTFGAVAVLAIYFIITACRSKFSRTTCVISWAVASWFVGFSYLILGIIPFLSSE